jgi:uncharacterized protein with PIN domain
VLLVRVPPELRPLMHSRRRGAQVPVRTDGTSTLLHLVESLGIPRTEIGELRRATGSLDVVDVVPVPRPQRLRRERFLLDVHLGALARRMRLLGLDTAYRTEAADDELVAAAIDQERVLLTRDRGLLRRGALPAGAFVRGQRTDEQLADVLDRFAPALAPWTRCPACNGPLAATPVEQVAHLLEAGTLRSYTGFSRCAGCGRVYWRGAHARRLDAVVRAARSPSDSRLV